MQLTCARRKASFARFMSWSWHLVPSSIKWRISVVSFIFLSWLNTLIIFTKSLGKSTSMKKNLILKEALDVKDVKIQFNCFNRAHYQRLPYTRTDRSHLSFIGIAIIQRVLYLGIGWWIWSCSKTICSWTVFYNDPIKNIWIAVSICGSNEFRFTS